MSGSQQLAGCVAQLCRQLAAWGGMHRETAISAVWEFFQISFQAS